MIIPSCVPYLLSQGKSNFLATQQDQHFCSVACGMQAQRRPQNQCHTVHAAACTVRVREMTGRPDTFKDCGRRTVLPSWPTRGGCPYMRQPRWLASVPAPWTDTMWQITTSTKGQPRFQSRCMVTKDGEKAAFLQKKVKTPNKPEKM